MTLLEARGMTKTFDGLVAVDHIDLSVFAGETLCVIGPNGAGKSTFINLVTGLLEPTDGSVVFRDEEITDAPPHEIVQRGVSRSFQTASIFPDLSVRENAVIAALGAEHGSFRLNFLRRLDGFRSVEARAEDTLDAVGLLAQGDVQAAELPYGDKRRLEIGIALASDPDLLFLDEPTAGMSPEETDATVDLIERLQDDRGLTIVLVEHDMEVIFRVADRIAVLNRGQKIADGPPEEIRGESEVQEAYLGGVDI